MHLQLLLATFCILEIPYIDANIPQKTPEICNLSQCPQRHGQSEVVKFCQSSNTTGSLSQSASCCLNLTRNGVLDVVGLDLSNCSLTSVTSYFSDLHNLQVLMLEKNKGLVLHADKFNGLTALKYLSLNLNTDKCPGGNNSWNSTERTDSALICSEEINLCNKNNVSCLNKNSECVLVGPGEIECLCLSGYYGYKCLRQGTFPTVIYSIVLCVCVVVISGFLWCTQRRKIKPKQHHQ